ncbi:MAG: PilZ domain-containing protein [Gammaproteobacteria bacterium]|jgi:c-di-GMP-binding flagellar brake protein YcgR|nr:PilZ domain-containing protein [Gammaproteobacteria bacterium]
MDDRRRYFRINDKVSLKYRVVQGIDVDTEIKRTEHEQNNLAEIKNAFNCIEAKIITKMGRIEEVSPLVAEVLSLYDKKLSLIESMILHKEDEENSITETQQINLSASGMSFESNTPINEDVNLKMELILFPEYQFIPLYACVVDCKKKMDDNLYRFNISVEFVGICESDQETIMQHVLSRQTASIKKERSEQAEETIEQ